MSNSNGSYFHDRISHNYNTMHGGSILVDDNTINRELNSQLRVQNSNQFGGLFGFKVGSFNKSINPASSPCKRFEYNQRKCTEPMLKDKCQWDKNFKRTLGNGKDDYGKCIGKSEQLTQLPTSSQLSTKQSMQLQRPPVPLGTVPPKPLVAQSPPSPSLRRPPPSPPTALKPPIPSKPLPPLPPKPQTPPQLPPKPQTPPQLPPKPQTKPLTGGSINHDKYNSQIISTLNKFLFNRHI